MNEQCMRLITCKEDKEQLQVSGCVMIIDEIRVIANPLLVAVILYFDTA